MIVFLRRILEGMGIVNWGLMKSAAAPHARIRSRLVPLMLPFVGEQETARIAVVHGVRRGRVSTGDFGWIGKGDIVVQSMIRSKGSRLALARIRRDGGGSIPASNGGSAHSQPTAIGESGGRIVRGGALGGRGSLPWLRAQRWSDQGILWCGWML